MKPNTSETGTAGWRPARVAVLLVALGLPFVLGGCFGLGSDTRALRDAAQQTLAPGGDWDEEIEISVGAVTLGLVRSISAFADVDDEARELLRTARAAEIGVYELRGRSARTRPAEFIKAATTTMGERSWERVVTVMDGSDTVAVFVPEDLDPDGPLKVCVVVFDGRELVVAQAKVNLGPAMKLALAERRKHAGGDEGA